MTGHGLQQSPRRVAVFRALQLGDVLCGVPALRSLRRGLPAAHISFVGLPWARGFADRFSHLVDDFIEFPGYPGLPERGWQFDAVAQFFAELRARDLDLAVQLHGSGGITNPLVADFGARLAAGFYQPGAPSPGWSFVPWERRHEIHQLLAPMQRLGMPLCGDHLEFPITPHDEREFAALASRHALRGPYVVVHGGSRMPSRRWPARRFSEVARALAERSYRIVLTGAAPEGEIAREIAARMGCASINLAGHTSLGSLAVLIREASLLVSNDTGVSHIAAALGTPSVIVACGSDVERWRPLDAEHHTVLSSDVPCRPCSYAECPIGHPCALGVSVSAVLAAAEALLGKQ